MKINKIKKKNQNLIREFFTYHGMGDIVDDIDFKLFDEAPNESYYSYYCEIEGKKFGVKIDYDDNYIMLHVDYKPKLINKIDEFTKPAHH